MAQPYYERMQEIADKLKAVNVPTIPFSGMFGAVDSYILSAKRDELMTELQELSAYDKHLQQMQEVKRA